ncbi:phenylalanine--tRNA ligase subunit beta [Candidatus Kaiserbacteria bacterium]|nr:phenylalanine--tRNA ligase subunit beta [Candidatus Kaiserbacteria bacterium]
MSFDEILDVKVTPNRGHDCLSHRGIAKEISAILNIRMKDDGLRKSIILEPRTDAVAVSIEAEKCNRFTAAYIRGVRVGPSPDWLREALESIGQRSINKIVDATNYVMFSLGQPLHAFDAGKLQSTEVKPRYKITVRNAKAGEKMISLDDKEYAFTETMMVVTDANADVPIGIAGLKGGKPSGVDEKTVDIILESANFDGVSVRKTAQALKLRTDASARFEQVLSPEMAAYGARAGVDLIMQLAGGQLVGFVDIYPHTAKSRQVSVTLGKINNVLGTQISVSEVEDVWKRLDMIYHIDGETFTIDIPFERLDLAIPEDLVEEIGRIVGYDKVPSTPLPKFPKKPENNQNFCAAERIREQLISEGYSEVFTSVFADKGERQVANKIGGDKPYLRANLTDSLDDALERNVRNKDLLGLKKVQLFEIGTVWRDGKEEIVVGKAAEKEKPSQSLLTPESADSCADLPSSTTEQYKSFSRYPFIVRDVAMWVSYDSAQDKPLESDAVLDVIRREAGELLVRSELFDRFEKGDRISYAFRLVFQSFEKTLTDVEVNEIMGKVMDAVKAKGWEVR